MFTASQQEVFKILGKYERLNPQFVTMGVARSTSGLKPAAITSLRKKGLVKSHHLAAFNSTYIELTDLGRQVVMAGLVFGE